MDVFFRLVFRFSALMSPSAFLMVWEGLGADPRTKRLARVVKGSDLPETLGVNCLLSDAELAELTRDIDFDVVFPDGPDPEMLQHPLYGPDLAFSMVLEYCEDRFDLSAEALRMNLWYRCERFVRHPRCGGRRLQRW